MMIEQQILTSNFSVLYFSLARNLVYIVFLSVATYLTSMLYSTVQYSILNHDPCKQLIPAYSIDFKRLYF
jgi:hypothetical protein